MSTYCHNTNMIVDVGCSEGNDIQYYLQKGFNVFGIEADPIMYESLLLRFDDEISGGSVRIINRVASDVGGIRAKFFRNERYPGLSTADYETAQLKEYLVPCEVVTVNWDDIINIVGVPYYCKVDIEGAEARFIRSMRDPNACPQFISVECHTFEPIESLFDAGYRYFKFVNQTGLAHLKSMLPNPPLEGNYVPDPNWTHASGPFGRELSDHWVSFEEATRLFDMIMQLKVFHSILGPQWFDCHATKHSGLT